MTGLDEILAHLGHQGRPPNDQTAREIIDLLEEAKNYIPSSEVVRRDYAYTLLKAYKEHLERAERTD